MKISLILSFITIVLAIIICLILIKNKKSIKAKILTLFIAGIISIAFLIYPLLEYNNIYLKGLASFIYATKCVGMGQDLKLLSKINLATKFGYTYFIFINTIFLTMPILTVSFIITYLEKLITYIKLSLSKNKKVYIFSEVNSKSLMLAKNHLNMERCVIIFTDVNEKKDINIKAIKLNKKIINIKHNFKNNITFYMISDNEDKNLNETLELINKYKTREKTKIYVINQNEDAPVILDSTDKGKLTVEIINEKERAIFNLLDKKPLFLNTIKNTISILIVGCGNIGKEFLKDSIWCGIMPGYKLKFLVVDINADYIKQNINAECPELLKNYDITFINEDIKSTKALKKLKKDINYILVATEFDNKNIDIAIMLRRLFLKNYNRKPIINLYIENDYKQKQIDSLVNEKGNEYDLNAFGNINDLYNEDSIIDSTLEKLAIQVHLSYDPDDKELYRYNLREYNKRSSRATALHIRYKFYALLKDKYNENLKESHRIFRQIYNLKVEKLLAENEHNRWNAYMRSIGYVCAPINEVNKYYQKNQHYINYLARMHPGLVKYHKLDKVSKKLSIITSKQIDLKESDITIIKNINDLIEF